MRVLFSVLLLLLAAVGPAEAQSECDSGTDPRIRQHLSDIVQSANVDFTVALCAPAAGGTPYTIPWMRYIIFPSDFSKLLDDEELRGVLAHEVGHVFRMQRKLYVSPPRSASVSERFEHLLAEEIAIDALASRWVGKQALVRALLKARELLPTLSFSAPEKVEDELARRLAALGETVAAVGHW